MYKVFRFVSGHKQNHIATFVTLREAFAYAQGEAAGSTSSVEYRIFGLLPEETPNSSGKSPHRTWFVLDNAPQPQGTVRASIVLHKLRNQSLTSKGTFRVDREAQGIRRTLREGFSTQAEARAYIARQKAKEQDSSALYIIVAPPDRPKKTRTPVGVRSRYLRGAPRLRGYAAGSMTQRTRHDWEFEDRKGDAALVERSEEELGLGIPAQTNKGRRSRKGEYIP